MNADKALYAPYETANFAFSLIDDEGKMVCNANLELRITNPELHIDDILSTVDGSIAANSDCQSKELPVSPDYQTYYQLKGSGLYSLQLTARTTTETYTISDTLQVKDEMPFVIHRNSTTRLYPGVESPMQITITANQDFKGTITETVPESFIITPGKDETSYDAMNTLYLEDKNNPEHNLKASDIKLHMPFDGTYALSQGYGTALTDLTLSEFYAKQGLAGHDGVDFALPENTILYAVDAGQVVYAVEGDYGVTVVIQHSWGKSYYGHLSKTTVEKGFHVTKGSQIGYSGNSGESTGPHLHFGMKPVHPDMHNGYAGKIDPLPYLGISTVLAASNAVEELVNSSVLVTTIASDSAGPDASSAAEKAFTISDSEINQAVAEDQPPVLEKVKVIKWDVDLKNGENIKLGYTLKAPLISPQFYLVGPLKFFAEQDGKALFTEERNWQFTADAVSVGWYNADWNFRKQITIDHSKVASNQTNFPVLINLPSDEDLAANTQSDGHDILFTDATGQVKLSHEIETYTSAAGALTAWVNVPNLSAVKDTNLFVYYGNAKAENQEDRIHVWDPHFKAVWHLDEDPSGSAPQILDASQNPSNATTSGTMMSADSVIGQVGKGLRFDAIDDAVNAGSDSKLDDLPSMTISGWVNARTQGENAKARLIQKNADIASTNGWQLFFDDVSEGGIDFDVNHATGNLSSDFNEGRLQFNSWQYVTLTWDGSPIVSQAKLFTNGIQVGTKNVINPIGARVSDAEADVLLGNSNSRDRTFDGVLDEMRIADTVRSADWIQTEYTNQHAPTAFYTLGNPETKLLVPLEENKAFGL